MAAAGAGAAISWEEETILQKSSILDKELANASSTIPPQVGEAPALHQAVWTSILRCNS